MCDPRDWHHPLQREPPERRSGSPPNDRHAKTLSSDTTARIRASFTDEAGWLNPRGLGGQPPIAPLASAMATASVRLDAPSFRIAEATYSLTV
jgi:hypothetical protein